jgi:aminoglycoside 3'-phosphotransferase-1
MPTMVAVPDPVRAAVAGYDWLPATDGQSGGTVFRLEAPDQPTLYLKCGTDHVADDITAEMARLTWFAGRVPVPEVRHFVRAPRAAYLLTTAVRGRSAHDCLTEHPAQRPAIVAALADFLQALHALPLTDCPFHAGHELRLVDARRNLDGGRVDASDFDAAREGWSAEQVWAAMTGLLPLTFARVVTHGDFTLDNVLLEDGRVTGCIDVGRAGAADPYQDLALLWRDLEAFGGDAQDELLRAYGVGALEERKLRFHLCLDEFF